MGCAVNANAAEPKAMKDVDISALTNETQKSTNADGVHLAWWIPPEFWAASMEREQSMSAAARKQMLDILNRYSMLAVVQADVSSVGNFSFYDRATVTKGLKFELVSGKETSVLKPLEKVPEELDPLLKVMTPLLESAMGRLGENLNFFVYDDQRKGGRVISPYAQGALKVTLAHKDGKSLDPFVFELPLDSLYVARLCPNGKPAHVSWVVCPWDGTKLPL
jgi:hypothetical protein